MKILCVLQIHGDSAETGGEVAVELGTVVPDLVPLHGDAGVDLSGTHVVQRTLPVVRQRGVRYVVLNISVCKHR